MTQDPFLPPQHEAESQAAAHAALEAEIERRGPMPISQLLRFALQDPDHGYYRHKPAIGRSADFITSPEISHRFGQAVGHWVEQAWRALGKPDPFWLIELGPGRGVMMQDLIACLSQDCAAAAQLALCDVSPSLRRQQAERLGTAAPTWFEHWSEIPEGAKILVGNEFLDTLAIEQIIKHKGQWHLRCVDRRADTFAFVLGPELNSSEAARLPLAAQLRPVFWPASMREALDALPDGALVEIPCEAASLFDFLTRDLRQEPSAALFIDYGPAELETGDTLQAIVSHTKVPVLPTIGCADLTTRVNFAWLLAFCQEQQDGGAPLDGPISQAQFLARFGEAPAPEDSEPSAAWQRLTDPQAMGSLFQAVAIRGKSCPALL